MTDSLDVGALNAAIEKAEKDLKVKPKNAKPKEEIKETKTIKKGNTKRTVTKKQSFKSCDEFKNHPLAESINNIANKWAMSEDIANKAQLGEAVALTLDFYMGDIPNHPLAILAFSSAIVAFTGMSNRKMLPDFTKFTKVITPDKKTEEKVIHNKTTERKFGDQKIVMREEKTQKVASGVNTNVK